VHRGGANRKDKQKRKEKQKGGVNEIKEKKEEKNEGGKKIVRNDKRKAQGQKSATGQESLGKVGKKHKNKWKGGSGRKGEGYTKTPREQQARSDQRT